jgi:hypothetical protein
MMLSIIFTGISVREFYGRNSIFTCCSEMCSMHDKPIHFDFKRSEALLPDMPYRRCMRWKHSEWPCKRVRLGTELGGRNLHFEKLPNGKFLALLRFPNVILVRVHLHNVFLDKNCIIRQEREIISRVG